MVIGDETRADDDFRRTHEAISDRFIVADDTLGVGAGWAMPFGSVDIKKPALIPAFAMPYTHPIR